MDLNVLVRGQSNSILMMEAGNFAGRDALRREVERLLGFDGTTDRINLIYDSSDWNSSTAFGGTALIGDWLTPRNNDWRQGWTVAGREQALLREIASVPATQRDDPTAILWLHSEYDSARTDLTAEEWVSAVRFDASQTRAALGQGAATTPYLFVSAMPYYGTTQGHNAIRQGMEQLAADAGFNAHVAARMLDIDADGDQAGAYGGGHIDTADGVQTALRSARAIAEAFSNHAKPGSPVAVAGGNIADEGPQVIRATPVGTNQLRLDVRHDGAGGFQALDADAANGAGWSVIGAGGAVVGTAAALVDADTLLVTFSGPLPQGGLLHYGHGYGRLAGADGSGRGNAVYDDQGLPIWVPAQGLAPVTPATVTPTPGVLREGTAGDDRLNGNARNDTLVGGAGNDRLDGRDGADSLLGGDGQDQLLGNAGADTLFGGAGADTLRGGTGDDRIATGDGEDRVAFWTGDGADVVTDFALGLDRVSLGDVATSNITATVVTRDGTSGFELRLPGGDTLFLAGIGAVAARDLKLKGEFAAAPPPPPPPAGLTVDGTPGADFLRGAGGADTLSGGGGADDLQGFDGDDWLRGGTGDDGMTGGAGADTFVFARGDGKDWVEDFQPGTDKVRLVGISAAEVSQAVETRWSYPGVALRYGADEVFLAGPRAPLAAGDIIYA
jgi:Ca2+-binding RTX toxin-like protein